MLTADFKGEMCSQKQSGLSYFIFYQNDSTTRTAFVAKQKSITRHESVLLSYTTEQSESDLTLHAISLLRNRNKSFQA